MPNLIEVQKNSYDWFLKKGLKEVFEDISPITDYSGHLSLEFTDFSLCEEEAKYSIEECKERDATYAAPLKVKVRLINKETDSFSEHEIFMGDLPLMTATGTFVINGAERVIVSQLVRSLVFTMVWVMISLVRSFTPQLLSRTVVHGWNMRQIPTIFTMYVWTEHVRYLLQC
ncbi:MAG: hypothetical protein ACLVIT_01340 [Coprococcus sp.]